MDQEADYNIFSFLTGSLNSVSSDSIPYYEAYRLRFMQFSLVVYVYLGSDSFHSRRRHQNNRQAYSGKSFWKVGVLYELSFHCHWFGMLFLPLDSRKNILWNLSGRRGIRRNHQDLTGYTRTLWMLAVFIHHSRHDDMFLLCSCVEAGQSHEGLSYFDMCVNSDVFAKYVLWDKGVSCVGI